MKYQKPINSIQNSDEFSSNLMEAYGRWMGGDCFQNTQPVDLHLVEAFDGMDPQSHGAEIEDTTKKKKTAKKESSAAQLEIKKESCGPEHSNPKKKKETKKEEYEVLETEEYEIDGVTYVLEKVKMDGKDDNGFKTCWKGYRKQGTKVKGDKEVNNCVKAGFEPDGEVVSEKMDPVGGEDKDIDNDGDHDKSDKYLHARRKKIGKILAMKGKK
jgi:hypothetical protein